MNPYVDAQHHDHQYYTRPEPHLPLRRASSQRLHAAREGPRPFFANQQHSLRGFKPSTVQPAAQINNITASTEHAFAGRDERSKAPFKPPLGVQAMQRSPGKSRYPSGQSENGEYRRGKTPSPLVLQGSFDAGRTQPSSPLVSEVSQTEQRRQPLSPLSPMAAQSMQDISRRLRGSKSVGEGLRGKQRSTSDHSNKHSPVFQTDGSTEFMQSGTGMTQHDIRTSMLSAVTWQSSRVNSGSVNTEHSSFITVNSSISDFMHVSAEPAEDKERRISFDVDDAIGMYENGFESVKNSMDERRPSSDQRPSTAHGRSQQQKYLHRRSQSASVLDRFSAPTTNNHASFVSETNNTSATAVPRDRYGFKTASHYVTAEQYDRWNRNYTDHLERRRRRWYSMMESYGLSTDNPIRFPPKSDKIKRYVRKGIPPEWRGAAWFWYAGGPGLLKKDPDVYKRLLESIEEGKLTENDREHIERDLNRTFPDNIRFKPDATASLDGRPLTDAGRQSTGPESTIISALRRVLQAFAVHNPSVGYCQSLNFIAGLLLLFLDEDEEKAFILLDLITSTHLPGTHGVTLEGANIDIAVLMSCIKDSLPNVWAKLDDKADPSALPPVAQTLRLPTVSLATTAWFMSLFVGTLPIECVLRAWDCLFFEGSKTLFRIALAIFKYGEKQIVGVNDPMEIFQMVQTIPRSMLDVNALMEVCFKRRGGFGYLSQDVIERRREERRKQVKAGIGDAGGWRSRLRSKTTKI